jgi:hypothetical protein
MMTVRPQFARDGERGNHVPAAAASRHNEREFQS